MLWGWDLGDEDIAATFCSLDLGTREATVTGGCSSRSLPHDLGIGMQQGRDVLPDKEK